MAYAHRPSCHECAYTGRTSGRKFLCKTQLDKYVLLKTIAEYERNEGVVVGMILSV